MAKQIGYAVLGAGELVRKSVLPAFSRSAEHSRLIAVVSSDRAEAQTVAQEFRATPYHFDELRQCLAREDVNAVYIAVPNALHCDYAVEAARAGAHVLCERPMAVTADECRRILRTCQTNHVKLMVAYRWPFQPGPLKAIELVRAGAIGLPKTFSADFTVKLADPDDLRLQRRLGGGSMYDLGVHTVNAARSLFAAEPAQVMAMTARTSRRYGGDVDESGVALIRFPDERLAHLHTSFGEEPMSTATIYGEDGLLRLTNAYSHTAPMTLTIVRGGHVEELTFDAGDPFGAAIGYFSDCVVKDRQPEPSGIDGLQDVRIVEAIYRSARDGRPVTLPRLARVDAPAAGGEELGKAEPVRRQAS
jgi:glucose-fructose oxidoreductase